MSAHSQVEVAITCGLESIMKYFAGYFYGNIYIYISKLWMSMICN